MSCGCKKKKQKSSEYKEEVKNNSWKDKIISFFKACMTVVLATIAMPFIYGFVVVAIFKGNFGDGVDLGKTIRFFKKKEKLPSEEEINPEDFDLVGVEKIV